MRAQHHTSVTAAPAGNTSWIFSGPPRGVPWVSLLFIVAGLSGMVQAYNTSNTIRNLASDGMGVTANLSWIEREGDHFLVSVSYTAAGRTYDNKIAVTPSFARTVSTDFGSYGGLTPTSDKCQVLYHPADPKTAIVAGGTYDEGPRSQLASMAFLAFGMLLLIVRVIRQVLGRAIATTQ